MPTDLELFNLYFDDLGITINKPDVKPRNKTSGHAYHFHSDKNNVDISFECAEKFEENTNHEFSVFLTKRPGSYQLIGKIKADGDGYVIYKGEDRVTVERLTPAPEEPPAQAITPLQNDTTTPSAENNNVVLPAPELPIIPPSLLPQQAFAPIAFGNEPGKKLLLPEPLVPYIPEGPTAQESDVTTERTPAPPLNQTPPSTAQPEQPTPTPKPQPKPKAQKPQAAVTNPIVPMPQFIAPGPCNIYILRDGDKPPHGVGIHKGCLVITDSQNNVLGKFPYNSGNGSHEPIPLVPNPSDPKKYAYKFEKRGTEFTPQKDNPDFDIRTLHPKKRAPQDGVLLEPMMGRGRIWIHHDLGPPGTEGCIGLLEWKPFETCWNTIGETHQRPLGMNNALQADLTRWAAQTRAMPNPEQTIAVPAEPIEPPKPATIETGDPIPLPVKNPVYKKFEDEATKKIAHNDHALLDQKQYTAIVDYLAQLKALKNPADDAAFKAISQKVLEWLENNGAQKPNAFFDVRGITVGTGHFMGPDPDAIPPVADKTRYERTKKAALAEEMQLHKEWDDLFKRHPDVDSPDFMAVKYAKKRNQPYPLNSQQIQILFENSVETTKKALPDHYFTPAVPYRQQLAIISACFTAKTLMRNGTRFEACMELYASDTSDQKNKWLSYAKNELLNHSNGVEREIETGKAPYDDRTWQGLAKRHGIEAELFYNGEAKLPTPQDLEQIKTIQRKYKPVANAIIPHPNAAKFAGIKLPTGIASLNAAMDELKGTSDKLTLPANMQDNSKGLA